MNLKLNDLFKKNFKSKRGSALPFVLIIGLIMMILVGSLTAVAVGGIQFTQESVESRQAYLDAKSVIEFARIEINENYETTKVAYTFSKDKSTFIRPVGGPLFYVYGVPRASAGEDLKLRRVEIGNNGNPGEVRLGTAVLVEDFNNPGTNVTDITLQYHYEIMTENLERQLNYKTGFSYTYKEKPGTGGGTGSNLTKIAAPTLTELQALGMPKLSDAPNSSGWPLGNVIFDYWSTVTQGNDLYYTSTSSSPDIHATKESGNWVLNVPKSGSDLKLKYSSAWSTYIKLAFQARNLETPSLPSGNSQNCEYQYDVTGTLYINGDLKVYEGCKVIINANKVIVNGGIIVNGGGVLTITANEGVYVNNDVDIRSGNTISARNIYIGGSLKTSSGSQTQVVVSATNIYINGNISLSAKQSKLTAETLVVKNNLSGSSNAIECTSASETLFECSKLWLNGPVEVKSESAKIVFNRLYYLECKGMNLGNTTKLELNGANDTGNRLFIDGSLSNSSSFADIKFNNISYAECESVDLKSGTNFTFNGFSSGGSRFVVKGDVHHSGAGLFSLNNLYWFECRNLTFHSNTIIDVHSQVVKVGSQLELLNGMSRDKSGVFDTQYLSVGGATRIQGGPSEIITIFTCKSFPGKGNFIFAGGYDQQNATVQFENAENIIMQGVITFATNCRLAFKADKIYLDSDQITHKDSGNSNVSFGGIKDGAGTDFYIKGLISWKDKKIGVQGNYLYQIGNGVYKTVEGESLKTLDEKTKFPYQGPGAITIPGTGGSSPTETGEIKSINDAGVYY